jgi:mRNA interferase MazF
VKRRDIAVAVVPGHLGKPGPVLIVQADLFVDRHPTITILPFTSELVHAPVCRILVEPSAENGLREISQIMVDKPMSIRRDRIAKAIGRLDDDTMLRVSRALAVWMGIA